MKELRGQTTSSYKQRILLSSDRFWENHFHHHFEAHCQVEAVSHLAHRDPFLHEFNKISASVAQIVSS